MKIAIGTGLVTMALLATTFVGCQPEADIAGSSTDSDSAETVTLSEQLTEKALAHAAAAPAKRREASQAGIDTVRESGIEKSAKQVGDSAIDGELIGWNGKTVRLSKVWSDGPVVLMWYRGGWCPYCNIQLRAMQKTIDELERTGARLIVLTPELPEKAKKTADANNLDLVALRDRENRLAEKYGITFDVPAPIVPVFQDKLKLASYNGSDELQLPLAATYVIDQSGKITYAFLDADYKKRAEPTEIINAVVAVNDTNDAKAEKTRP